MTALALTNRLPPDPETPEERIVRAAVSWCSDQTCSLALAELEDAVASYREVHPDLAA